MTKPSPEATLLLQKYTPGEIAEQAVKLDEYLDVEISLKLEAIVKLTKLEADNAALKEQIKHLQLQVDRLRQKVNDETID